MVKINLNIGNKAFFLLIGVLALIVIAGFAFAIGSGDPYVMGHTADEIAGFGGLQKWESEWYAVSTHKIYVNGGLDDKGNSINLNHNLGGSSLVIQVLFALDSGTFPSSPNLSTITYNTANRDSNIDYRNIHDGLLVQDISMTHFGKLVTGAEGVGIYKDGSTSWGTMNEDKGWIKIIAIK